MGVSQVALSSKWEVLSCSLIHDNLMYHGSDVVYVKFRTTLMCVQNQCIAQCQSHEKKLIRKGDCDGIKQTDIVACLPTHHAGTLSFFEAKRTRYFDQGTVKPEIAPGL